MSNWDKIQIGNFIVEKIEMDGMDYVEIRTVGGEWRVMYRADTNMYNLIVTVSATDIQMRDAIKVIITNIFSVSSIVDGEFQHDIVEAIFRHIGRVKALNEMNPTEEQKVLEEEKAIREMKRESRGY